MGFCLRLGGEVDLSGKYPNRHFRGVLLIDLTVFNGHFSNWAVWGAAPVQKNKTRNQRLFRRLNHVISGQNGPKIGAKVRVDGSGPLPNGRVGRFGAILWVVLPTSRDGRKICMCDLLRIWEGGLYFLEDIQTAMPGVFYL